MAACVAVVVVLAGVVSAADRLELLGACGQELETVFGSFCLTRTYRYKKKRRRKKEEKTRN